MSKTQTISLLVGAVAIFVCGWSLRQPTKDQFFGSEAIRRRLRLPHWLVIVGSVLTILGIFARKWFTVSDKPPVPSNPWDWIFLTVATVLVLFMLFGFVSFEAGGVSSAYRNESTEKNLLVIMFSLAAYLLVGRLIYNSFAPRLTDELASVFQAGFACTVSLIISNALTERASKATNILCAIFAAGLGYPLLAGVVWGDIGLLHQVGFVDASGANAVHLLGAAASLTAIAMVGPRARLQRWRFLGGLETPDFRSDLTIVGGLFLFFGWLGFNSGNAPSGLHEHAILNTTVGACSGALAAWLLSRGLGLRKSSREFGRAESEQTTLSASIKDHPRIVIGMMGGLVAVTANGYLLEVRPWMAAFESALGGVVAVVISTWMSVRSHSAQIDDPLGVVGTHGCAAIVGLLSTTVWLGMADSRWGQHLLAQLMGCGMCIVVGWLVAIVPCWILLTVERQVVKGSWRATKFRLRLSAVGQLGMPQEMPNELTPEDQVWKYRVEEAARRIIDDAEGDTKWWKALKTYAKAAELLDTSKQEDIAQRIVKKLHNTADLQRERVALVALGGSAMYEPEIIHGALSDCLARAKSNGNGRVSIDALNGEPSRKEWLVWSISLLTERAAVSNEAAELNEAGIPSVVLGAREGLSYLEKTAVDDRNNYSVREHARVGVLDAYARLDRSRNGDIPQKQNGSFERSERWKMVHVLVTNETALPMLLFLTDRGSAMLGDAVEEFHSTPEVILETAKLLRSHGLISFDAQNKKMTIKDDGRQLVKQLRHSEDTHDESIY